MSHALSSPAFEWPAELPATLSGLVQFRIRAHGATRCVEIDATATRRARTIDEQFRRSLVLLGALREHAPARESDLVLCFESALDMMPAIWASIFDGRSCLPWHFQRTAKDVDTQAWLDDVGANLNTPVLVTTESLAGQLASVGRMPFASILTLEQMSAAQAAVPMLDEDMRAGELLVLTSGTTGRSKIVATSGRAVISRHVSKPPTRPGQHRLVNFPFGGLTGYPIIFPSPADHVYLHPERFTRPLDVLQLVEEFRIHSFSTSSSLAARFVEAVEAAPRKPDLSSLGHVGFGSEPIVPDVVSKFCAMLRDMGTRDVQLSFGYGMTETGVVCRTNRMGLQAMQDRMHASSALASVGGCAPGWSLRVIDADGRAASEGTTGAVEVWSSTHLFSGYRNDPELTSASVSGDGWFRTGDVGRIEHGELVLTGRQKSIIIINGRNISLESIEAPLRAVDGVARSLVAAVAVRSEQSPTDELALFFVPRQGEPLDDLCRRLVDRVASQGLPVKHLVPVREPDFPLTPTGKVRRGALAEHYRAGRFEPHPWPRRGSGQEFEPNETQRWLVALWRRVLKLQFDPGLDDDFFALGGDSLISAELIFAVEERFSCVVPIESFFARPTITTMAALLVQHTASDPATARERDGGLLHKLRCFSASWRGHRQLPDSLIVGFNVTGTLAPIVWITQEYREAVALARHLGPEQPLYVGRSCVQIVPVKEYSTRTDVVTDRYVWELLSLRIPGPFVLGGTCQGAIMALAIARKLERIDRAPSALALLEWHFSCGLYTGPTMLLYGRQSFTAGIFEGTDRGVSWRADFPNHTVVAVPGAHSHIAEADESVARIAEALRAHGTRKRAPSWLSAPLRHTGAALRRIKGVITPDRAAPAP